MLGFSYHYTPSSDAGGALIAVLGIMFLLIGLVCVLSLALYILQAFGMYTIAKRRGIRNPWLAWVPVGTVWILGSISDQYRYAAKGQVRGRRKVLLGLAVGTIGLAFLMMVCVLPVIIIAAAGGTPGVGYGLIPLILLMYLAMFAAAIASAVFQYMALYDLYMSCDPVNAVVYLLLSIFINVTQPFILFFNRKKDLGMPPQEQAQLNTGY